jgi:vacuolar-type H+-ATPase catalytic subunit A/Vma1
MMRIMLDYFNLLNKAIEEGIQMEKLKGMQCRESIGRMATVPNDNFDPTFKKIEEEIADEIKSLGGD